MSDRNYVLGKKLAVAIVVALMLGELALLVTGRRLLIYEHRVEPGETYSVAEYGDLGKSSQASLYCRYFTGRDVLERVFWYSPNNMFGRDSCPFLASEG